MQTNDDYVYDTHGQKYHFADGYTEGNGASYFHYYIRDHQGNNRVVANNQGTIEQTTHYYPYGGILSQSTNQGVQKFKYNGKEFDRMHGLDVYDFGARQQDPETGLFTSMDPLCEKYYNISPYMYCAGNPIRYVDPDGRKVYVFVMKLPSLYSWIRNSGATHTFTVVQKDNGEIFRYAYGPTDDTPFNAICGTTPIVERKYSQDEEAVNNYFYLRKIDSNTKNVVPVNVPKGMSESEFDDAVINSARQFRDNKTIKYRIVPTSENEGNCNTSTTSLLKNAGVNEQEIDRIDSEVSGIDIGFGTTKPWTKEQRKSAEAWEKERMKMSESLSNNIGF